MKCEIISIVNPNDDHNRRLFVTIKFPDGEIYRGYVDKDIDYEIEYESDGIEIDDSKRKASSQLRHF